MKTVGYYNGQIGEIEEVRIPMYDRACYFGDGVYDATIAVNRRIIDIDMHIARFYNSARLLEIEIPMEKEEFKSLLLELSAKIEADTQFVYWQVSRGAGRRQHVFPEGDSKGILWVMMSPFELEDFSKKLHLITLEDTRFLHCNIKTLNLIPSVLASEKAKRAGCQEAVLHRGDRVTECAHSNVHILKDGVLHTAPTDNLILPGITRINLLDTCRSLGVPVDETPFTLDELFDADEVIVSSSGVLCLSADRIDGKPVGGKDPELYRKIQDSILEQFYNQTAEE